MLRENFGQDRLCNTHNELLTELVNTGALGVCLYAGIFISFIRGCMKTGRRNPQAYLYGVCAFCYLAHNMVSFAQVLNLPFAFVLMGMGEAVRRKLTSPRILPTIMVQCRNTQHRGFWTVRKRGENG